MTTPLTPERETEIRERAEAATPGPWSSTVIDVEITSLRAGGQTARDSVRVGWLRNISPADTELVTHSGEDIDALLAELDRVRESLAQEQANYAAYRRGAELAKRHLTERINSPIAAPRTERSYWVAIADALNAAEHAGMPIGIDLDGTVTDHNAWSVVWDRTTEKWAVAGYDEEATS